MSSEEQQAARGDPSSLEGDTLLVTGAASGIGLAVVHAALARGAAVVALDLSEAVHRIGEGSAATTGCSGGAGRIIATATCDVTDPGDVDVVLGRLLEGSRLDSVVHSAAVSVGGNSQHTSREDWERVVATNLTGSFAVARAVIPRLAASRSAPDSRPGAASLVLVASQLGLVGALNNVAYAASKGGVVNLVRALALDHGAEGVRVNALCPGPTETPFLQRSFDRTPDPQGARARSLAAIPLGRFGTSTEMAEAALFLSSRASSFVHGTTLVVDGGYLAQ